MENDALLELRILGLWHKMRENTRIPTSQTPDNEISSEKVLFGYYGQYPRSISVGKTLSFACAMHSQRFFLHSPLRGCFIVELLRSETKLIKKKPYHFII